MNAHKLKGIVLVTLQVTCLLYILVTTPVKWSVISFILLVISILLLVWAISSMSRSKLRVLPDPAKWATLVTIGPYRFVRHPMYTSLIIGSLALVILYPATERIAVLIILILVLLLKLNYEEKMLSKKFAEYSVYKQKTYRLIPYIL